MIPLRFLIDECVSHDIIAHLRDIEPDMDLLVVGEPGAPIKGTDDAELLLVGETQERALISGDRSTMTQHLTAHFGMGRHTAGVILLRAGFSVGQLASEIRLVWVATTADEWVDRTDYIPYRESAHA